MSDLPRGWAKVTLGEVADQRSGNNNLIKGKLEDQRIEGFYPAFSASGQDVWRDGFDYEREAIIVSSVGGRCGKSFLASGKWSAIANTHIVFPDTGLVYIHFLYFILNNERFWEKGGSAQPFVKVKATFKRTIFLPPLPEQQRIVAKINSLTDKSRCARNHLEQIPRLVKKYKEAVLSAALQGDLTSKWRAERNYKKEWRTTNVSEHFVWSSGKNLSKNLYVSGNVPVIGGNGVSGYHNEAIINFPTLIIGRVGAQCGNVHFSSGPAWITDNAIYARSVSSQIYILYAIMFFRHAKLNRFSGGSGQPYINQNTLNGMRFSLPNLEEQREIVHLTKMAYTWIDNIAANATSASKLVEQLDQAILAKAFKGELVPQDPNDEPASALLERIRAERAAAPKPKRGCRKKV